MTTAKTTEVESDSQEEEIAAAVAKLSKAGEKVDFVEKPGVLVEKYMEAKSDYEELLTHIDGKKNAVNDLADKLAKHYGIQVSRIGGTSTQVAEIYPVEDGVAYNPVRTMSVDEIRADASYDDSKSEESFAAQISSGIEMAFRGLK